MPNEASIPIATVTVALLLLGGVLLAARGGPGRAAGDLTPRRSEPDDAVPATAGSARSALRVLWWLGIAGVLIGVGASGSYPDTQVALFGLGGLGVGSVLVFHELLPARRRSVWLGALEGVVAIALVTGVLLLTGYASSPFAVLYVLVVVAGALSQGVRAAFALATLATAAFGAALSIDPARDAYTGAELLRFALQVGSLWLLAYLASIYAVQQRRMLSRAIELSRTDPLTGLYNRAEIMDTLDREVRRTRRSDRGFCLLMIDLDGLKRINDSFGHHRGDDVLRALGSVIGGSIRGVDSAYRFGGDEFMVLLPETDIVGAFVVAEKIRAGAEEVGLALGGDEALTSVSIGLVSHPEDGLSADDLMIAADRAMYHAKSQGKNQISGNPRPRPIPALPMMPHPEATAIPVGPAAVPSIAAAAPGPEPEPASAATVETPAVEATLAEPAAAGPTPAPDGEEAGRGGNGAGPRIDGGDEEPDPTEVRRQIAAATRSFDPDDQIRRAMDAFLSTGPRADPPRDR